MSQKGDCEKEAESPEVGECESEENDRKIFESQDSENRKMNPERNPSSASQQRQPIPTVRHNKPVPYDDEIERNYNQRRRSQDDLDLRMPQRYNRGRYRRNDDTMPRLLQRKSLYSNYSEESSHDSSSLPYDPGYEAERIQYERDFQALTPKCLIDELLQSPSLQVPLLHLVETYNFRPAAIRSLVSDFSHIFTMKDNKVHLQLQIKVCENHLGQTGCRNRLNCKDVHICQKYVADLCSDSCCLFGHKLNTNHNSRILNEYHIDHLPVLDLKKLLKLSLHAAEAQEKLDLCKDYNEGKCANRNCDSLHICKEYITSNMNCGKQECSLNHNLLSPGCRWLLERRGIDTNEAPRDILGMLLEVNPSMGQFSSNSIDNFLKPNDSHQTISSTNSSDNIILPQVTDENNSILPTQNAANTDESNAANADESNTANEDESNTANVVSLNDDNATNITIHTSRDNKTSISSDHGPSLIPDLSTSTDTDNTHVDSSSDSNSNLSNQGTVSGRDTLHSSDTNTPSDNSTTIPVVSNISRQTANNTNTAPVRHDGNRGVSRSLWSHQLEGDVRVSEICYDSVENACPLETNGCPRLHSTRHFHWQVSEESYSWLNLQPNQVLCLEHSFCNPGIDAVTLPTLNQQQLDPAMQILLLIMGEESWRANFQGMILVNSDESRILYLRRLSTEIIPGLTVEQSIYHWFYCESNGVWTEYGETSSGEETHLHYVNSEAIESQYMINPNSFAQFSIANNDYILDFNTMTQINQSTQEVTNVRRRPSPHLPFQEQLTENQSATSADNLTLSERTFGLLRVDSSDDELTRFETASDSESAD